MAQLNSPTINHPAVLINDERYHLLDQIGAGSMGVVYRALDRLTDHPVALKKVGIRPEPSTGGKPPIVSQDLGLALAREFQALASLHHPNIVTVLDYGFDADDTPYLVMELFQDARTICVAGQQQPVSIQIALLVQMLQALAYVHRRGMVHRDLKPANVLVTHGQVKVLDFGLAVDRGKSTDVVGTLTYMPPEVLMGQPADVASDLYSFGMIACEMFGGKHPFRKGVNADATRLIPSKLMEMIQSLPPETFTQGLEPGIAAVLNRLLQKQPADRYARAEQVMEALTKLLDQPPPLETAAIRESFLQAAQFIGRDRELEQLSAALSEANTGKGSVWLVGGESGVGKSRLVGELRILALVQRMIVLRGQAVSEGGQPYQEWRDVLRWLALQTPLTDLEGGVLKPLVSDIARLQGRPIPDVPALDPQATTERFISVVEGIMVRQQRPILIALEDLQWMGSEGHALLTRLSRKIASLPILIVGNYRDDEPVSLPDEVPPTQRIKLNRLTEDDIVKLSESMLGLTGQHREVVNLLQRETEGNVFFLIEVVRALAEESGRLDNIGEVTLPTSILTGGVQQFVRRRLSRVPAEGQPLLLLAAVSGRDLDLKVLRLLATSYDTNKDVTANSTLMHWLSVCTDAAVLEATGEHWRFAHDKLREMLLSEIPTDKRAGHHRQVAQAIEMAYPGVSGSGSSVYASALTYHWSQAEDAVRTCYYAALAGEQALQSGAYHEAIRFLEQALRLSDGNMTLFQAATMEYQLGMAYYGLSNMESSRTHMVQALARLGWVVPTDQRQVYLTLAKELIMQLVRPARLLERYHSHSQETLLLASRICAHLTQVGYFTAEILSTALHTMRCLNFSEAAGTSPELARSYANMTIAAGLIPSDLLAQHYARQSLKVARTVGDPSTTAYSLYVTGFYQTTVGNWDKADPAFRESLHLLDALGDQRRWREGHANLGYMLGLQGKFEESYQVRAAFLDSAQRDEDIQAYGWSIAGMGEMAIWLHHTDEAIRRLKARLDLVDQLKDVLDQATPCYALLALAHWRAGQPDAARQAALPAIAHLAILTDSGFHSFHGFASLSELYLQMWEAEPGDTELAEIAARVTARLQAYARRYPIYQPWALRNDGMRLWLMGQHNQARRAWQQSLVRAVRLKMPYDEGLVLYEAARHLPFDDPQRHAYLSRAIERFTVLNAPYELARAQVALDKK